MIQVDPLIARPWIRGGGATVQGVTETDSFKPFRVQQSTLDYGAYAVMCDGSIRFVKTGIPDALFKAMVTIKAGDDTTGIDEWAPKVELTSRLRTGGPAGGGPAGPAQYVPKDWSPIALQVQKARFGVAIPPNARLDTTADRAEEKEFAAVWPGKNITLGAHAIYRPGLPTSDPGGAAAGTEVAHYLELKGLTQDGSITDAPALGGSKGKQFRAKPAADFKGTAVYRLWVVNEARLVLSVVGPADLKDADAEEYFKTALSTGGGSVEAPKFAKWNYWFNREARLAVKLPADKEPGVLGSKDDLFLMWPKDVEGGAVFTVALKKAKLDPTIDAARRTRPWRRRPRRGSSGTSRRTSARSSWETGRGSCSTTCAGTSRTRSGRCTRTRRRRWSVGPQERRGDDRGPEDVLRLGPDRGDQVAGGAEGRAGPAPARSGPAFRAPLVPRRECRRRASRVGVPRRRGRPGPG